MIVLMYYIPLILTVAMQIYIYIYMHTLLSYYRDIPMHNTTTRLWYKVLGGVE